MESDMAQSNANSGENQKETINSNSESELLDPLLILWKWKYIILAGTVILTMISIYLTLTTPKKYRATAVIDFLPIVAPNGIHNTATRMFSAKKIRSDIQMGLHDEEIIDHLKTVYGISLNTLSKLKIGYTGDSKYLKFSYASRDPQLGDSVLKALIQALKNKLIPEIKAIQDQYIHQNNSNIRLMGNKIDQANDDIKSISIRMRELDSNIKELNKKTEILRQKEKKASTGPPKNDPNKLANNDNLIYQNMELLNAYKNELFENSLELESRKFTIKESKLKIRYYEEDIAIFKDNVNIDQYINILKHPENNVKAVAGRTKLKIILAAIVAFLFMVFLSFLLDYVARSFSKRS
jgi:hypothetical protein